MSKSYVQELIQVYDCLFADAVAHYPELRKEFKRDRIRLNFAVDHRGILVFLKDLPAVGKHLDRSLASAQYKVSGLPLSKRVSNTIVIPKLFRGLYLLIFNSDGSLKGEPDEQAIMFLRTFLYCAKKAVVECSEEVKAADVAAFVLTDNSLPEPSKFWEGTASPADASNLERFSTSERYRFSTVCARFALQTQEEDRVTDDAINTQPSWAPEQSQHDTLLRNLDIVSGILISDLGSFNADKSVFKHGPGSVSDRKKGESKYTWTTWPDRLEQSFPLARYGFHSYATWAASFNQAIAGKSLGFVPSDEPCSKLVAVFKKYDRSRLIASEPAVLQWCQQCVKHWLYERTSHNLIGSFVRFNDQTWNQDLCVRGSLEGSHATIDMSEASDRVSCMAVECTFRSSLNLLCALQATRTHFLSQDLNRDLDDIIKVKKFATMGNACTFPVESIVFLTVAIAACLTARGIEPTKSAIRSLEGDVSVFGDDCIVPVDCRELFVWGLEVIDLKVNQDKSFWTGRFRESCGVDAFNGQNVTPVYWHAPYDATPSSYVSRLDTANNFFLKKMFNVSAFLARTITKWQVPLVREGSGVLGLYTAELPESQRFKRRYNSDLHRHELLVPSPVGRTPREPMLGHERVLQYFTENPEPHNEWESGVTSRPDVKIRLKWRDELDYVAKAESLDPSIHVNGLSQVFWMPEITISGRQKQVALHWAE